MPESRAGQLHILAPEYVTMLHKGIGRLHQGHSEAQLCTFSSSACLAAWTGSSTGAGALQPGMAQLTSTAAAGGPSSSHAWLLAVQLAVPQPGSPVLA